MKKKLLLLLLVLTSIVSIGACGSGPAPEPSNITLQNTDASLRIHFIDVGQGDATLIEDGTNYLLIDAGTNDSEKNLMAYLDSLGIQKFNYVIGTHPHEDHIGGLDKIIENYEIEEIIMPPAVSTTRTFENVIDALEAKSLAITEPVVSDVYTLGDASFTIIAPNKDYGSDYNNWSVGIRLTYGSTNFIFCGDAEVSAEKDILNNGLALQADVLKLSHHGSRTSTSDDFMNAVNPAYAVISCGLDNSYKHPHQEIIDKLIQQGIEIYRTDQQGTIVASCDGQSISWNQSMIEHTVPETSSESALIEVLYVLNLNSKKFHLPSCGSVSKISKDNYSETAIPKEELIEEGYEPCKSCNP